MHSCADAPPAESAQPNEARMKPLFVLPCRARRMLLLNPRAGAGRHPSRCAAGLGQCGKMPRPALKGPRPLPTNRGVLAFHHFSPFVRWVFDLSHTCRRESEQDPLTPVGLFAGSGTV